MKNQESAANGPATSRLRMLPIGIAAAVWIGSVFAWIPAPVAVLAGEPQTGPARPLLSRADLRRLKKFDRAQVFAVLGSFDDRGLSESQFVLQMGGLLDARRVPGLAEALEARDAEAVLSAVDRACQPPKAAAKPGAVSRARRDAADDVLAHRFSFYGEKHQLPADINWDHNPGTAHWGHDLNRFGYLEALTYLKSTTAHSTIKIDGQDQHSAGRRDTWIPDKPLDLGWRVGEGEVRARGVYDLGYGPKNAIAVIHRREIVFVRERCWLVFDSVEGAGEHQIESRFQFAPGRLILERGGARTDFKDANLSLRTVATKAIDDQHVEQGREDPRGGWYSDSYGKIEPAPALSMSVRAQLPWRAATLLFPWRGTAPPRIELAWDGAAARIRVPELGEVRVECSPVH